jgi:hypothetical protein
MVRVGGQRFVCNCGCNVFRHFHKWRGLHRCHRYECNACGQVYAGEPA